MLRVSPGRLALCLVPAIAYAQTTLSGYEYVVVGSGAGGGPVAANLAMAGYKTLLIEAGNDQGSNLNYTVPAFQAKSTEDPALSWDFFVRHYSDDTRQKRDYKLTYNLPGGGEYTGKNPPSGATIKGILYPRTNTLGGCTAHNALVSVYPHQSDFSGIVALTGDQSWSPSNMRKYFVKIENNQYLPKGKPGHGYSGWYYIDTAPLTLAIKDLQLTKMLFGAAKALGTKFPSPPNLISLLASDPNDPNIRRDTSNNLYQVPIASKDGVRRTVREFLLDVANAKDANGNKKYPLDIRLSCHVTKIDFDSSSPPRAIGVQFLDGPYLYRASPLSGGTGKPGSVKASKEVIIAGGSYNSPQILKLSGIGPADELRKFNIPVIKDLPGVGANLQDHYEVVVQGQMAQDFNSIKDCTFSFNGTAGDPCLKQWQAGKTAAEKGVYSSSGFAGHMLYKSPAQPDPDYDELVFGGPVNFRGYYPGYSVDATIEKNWWSWDMLKAHPQNRAGTVKLRSADPLDPPEILFNYFDTGSGNYQQDLDVITDSIKLARRSFASQSTKFVERLPGANVQTDEEIQTYIKDTAWGHHCSSTCPIGADNDPMAVLDSSFRVRGVSGLRVVDASVYPRIPGTFTLSSTYLVGEKASDVIISQR